MESQITVDRYGRRSTVFERFVGLPVLFNSRWSSDRIDDEDFNHRCFPRLRAEPGLLLDCGEKRGGSVEFEPERLFGGPNRCARSKFERRLRGREVIVKISFARLNARFSRSRSVSRSRLLGVGPAAAGIPLRLAHPFPAASRLSCRASALPLEVGPT